MKVWEGRKGKNGFGPCGEATSNHLIRHKSLVEFRLRALCVLSNLPRISRHCRDKEWKRDPFTVNVKNQERRNACRTLKGRSPLRISNQKDKVQ